MYFLNNSPDSICNDHRYLEGMERIIERDFYPDLKELKKYNEILSNPQGSLRKVL